MTIKELLCIETYGYIRRNGGFGWDNVMMSILIILI